MKEIPRRVLANIFLISFAGLMLQISLIRILSFVQSYNFAILVVSIALFGIAAGAVLVHMKEIKNTLYYSSIAFAITSVLSVVVASQISFDPTIASYDYTKTAALILYFLIYATPFFCFGITLAHAFRKYSNQPGKIYFANLTGSALGGAAALPAIAFFGQYAVTAAAVIGIAASLIAAKTQKHKLIAAACLALLFVPIPVNVSVSKEITRALNVPGSQLIDTKWDSFSRIDAINSSYTRYAPGLSLAYNRQVPEQIGILTDGGAMSALTIKDEYDYTEYLPSYLIYELKKSPSVLLINPKAGPDIIAGRKNKAQMSIIEHFPTIRKMAYDYRDFAGDIYSNTTIINEHGRKHVKTTKGYDAIILSLTGDPASSGIYGLSQDYDLTVEGLKDYYDALNDEGYLIVTRWLSYPPKESLRLFYMAKTVAELDNIVLFRSWSTVTLVIAKQADHNAIKNFTERRNFDIIYMTTNFTPNVHSVFSEPTYYMHIMEIIRNPDFHKEYLFDIKPVYDNKPFYYSFFKLSKAKQLHKIMGRNWQPFNDSGFLMLLLFAQSILLCIIFILLPMLCKYKLPEKKIFYFLLIGTAYMFVEITLIQSLVRIFGNITHSAAFTILIMLVSSGAGSYISSRFRAREIFAPIIIIVAVLSLFINRIIDLLLQLPSSIAILLAAAMIFPLGFFMGMPFPNGILKIRKKQVPWACAVDGAASVLSSIAALIFALFLGFAAVMALAAALYAGAWLSQK